MRYCHRCRRMTGGNPLYCEHCGCTYDAKLCPRRHLNPRLAQMCSQCGSSDLSIPQPKGPWWFNLVLWLITALAGLFLIGLSFSFIYRAYLLLLNQPGETGTLVPVALVLAGSWLGYIQASTWVGATFRRGLRMSLPARKRNRG